MIIIGGFFLAVNLFAFLIMWRDKVVSRKHSANRIPEGILFFLAVVFGSVGVWFGMFAFRHKTQKWYFLIGVPLIFVQNCAILYLIQSILSGNIKVSF